MTEAAPAARVQRASPERTIVLAPVAGIALHHVLTDDIELADAPDWAGSVATDPPVIIRHRVGDVRPEGLRRSFDASPSCTFFDLHGQPVVQFRGPVAGVPDQLLLTRQPGREYELVYEERPSVPMFQRAKDRTIYSMALAQRGRGYIVHACGFLLGGAGVLCPGLPSAGKSTMARLLGSAEGSITRLSDDRIALTRDGPAFRIWGTPWPGDERVIGAADGPLRAIVLLRHASRASFEPVAPGLAARRILDTLVLPLWDRGLMPQGLEFVHDLVSRVEIFELAYPPTVEAVTWMLDALEARGLDG